MPAPIPLVPPVTNAKRGIISSLFYVVLRGRAGAYTGRLSAEFSIGHHHLVQRRVGGHVFQLALPQIDELRGERLKLVSVSV